MKKYLAALAAVLTLSSCEKELDIDYRSVEPVYVVEGRVSNQGAEVTITRTRDMDDGKKKDNIRDAEVILSGDDGRYEVLEVSGDGVHYSEMPGTPGVTYTLTVRVGGREFVSSSTMQEPVEVEPLEFEWVKVAGIKVLMCSMFVHDIPGQENYYYLRLYKKDKNYRWSLLYDKGNDGELLSADMYCMTEDSPWDDDDIIEEGDRIKFEVRNVDRKTYNYLYSVAIAEDMSSNPLPDFTGECMGYFSAYSSTVYEVDFSFLDVK